MTLAPGSRLGPYEIAAKLGEGGMGTRTRYSTSVSRSGWARWPAPRYGPNSGTATSVLGAATVG